MVKKQHPTPELTWGGASLKASSTAQVQLQQRVQHLQVTGANHSLKAPCK